MTQNLGVGVARGFEGVGELPGRTSYLLGADPSRWRAGVTAYAGVRYTGVYDGVDLVYYGGGGGRVEYDFVVAPGADPGAVRMSFSGADGLEVDAGGALVLRTSCGDVRHEAPRVYQRGPGGDRRVVGRYAALGDLEVGFELGAYALMPDVKVIAPWREWDLLSRERLLAYADEHGIPVDFKKRKGEAPFSMDANLLHISYEGGVLEDPAAAPPEKGMWRMTVSPEKAPNKPELVELEFERGDLVAINGERMPAHELLSELNRLGGKHGVGRLDLLGRIAPQDGGAALGGNHAVDGVLLHQHDIADRDAERPAAATLAGDDHEALARLIEQGPPAELVGLSTELNAPYALPSGSDEHGHHEPSGPTTVTIGGPR